MIVLQITPEDVLLAYGPLGLGVLVLGWFGIFMFRRLIKELDALRAERDQHLQTMLEMVPLMRRSTEIHEKRQSADELIRTALKDGTDVLRANNELLRDIRRMLELNK